MNTKRYRIYFSRRGVNFEVLVDQFRESMGTTRGYSTLKYQHNAWPCRFNNVMVF